MTYRILILLAVSLNATAETKQNATDLKSSMHNILLQVQNLRPYMVSEEKFTDPKNGAKIGNHLDNLTKQVKALRHEQLSTQPGLKISKEMLQKQIENTNRIFHTGNKSYARWTLNSAMALCMNCHTQAPSPSANWGVVLFDDTGNDFDKAELLFTARNFDRALAAYDSIIDHYPENKMSGAQIERAIERKVAIFAKTKRDFKGGIESLEKTEKNENLPEYLKKNVKAWAALFRREMKVETPVVSKTTDGDIQKYVEKEMKRGLWDSMIDASNPRMVTNMIVSGVLYEYLNLHPDSSIKADLYYWLALCDRPLATTSLYSLADNYLVACMEEFSKNPTAQKCYKEYEINTILSYTGSSGTHLPLEIVRDLQKYKMLVFGDPE